MFSLLRRSAGIGMFFSFASRAGGAALSLLISLALARLLGPDGLGLYLVAVTIVTIGATISRLGLDNAILRFASIAHSDDDGPTMSGLYRKSFALAVTAGLIVSLGLFIGNPYLPFGESGAEEFHSSLAYMIIAVIPIAIGTLQGEFIKAIGYPGRATFVQTTAMPFFLLCGVLVLYWRESTGLVQIAISYAVAALLSALTAILLWRLEAPKSIEYKGKFDTRLLLRTSFPLLWVSGLNMVMTWTDILVLGMWVEPETVGVYGVSVRMATLVSFVLIAVNSVVAPRFAKLYAKNDHVSLEALVQTSALLGLLAASPILLVLLIAPELVLALFGNDFSDGASFLRILALGQLINVAVGSVGYLLMMTGQEKAMRNSVLVSSLLNLSGNLLLVPYFGATGAAVSTAASIAVMNYIQFRIVKRRLGLNMLGKFAHVARVRAR